MIYIAKPGQSDRTDLIAMHQVWYHSSHMMRCDKSNHMVCG